MWFTLPAHTPLYRVSRVQDTWTDVLAGTGAFFSFGGRYNIAGQPTVYASEDPLVALTEYGWHAGLDLCKDLGDHHPKLPYPVQTAAKLWRFELNTVTLLTDLTSPAAPVHLHFPAQLPWNPHPHQYHASQAVATRLRAHTAPRPEGLLAPSVRTPMSGAYFPKQAVLFVLPAPVVVPQTLAQRATLLDQWDIELEFGTVGTAASVLPTDPLVAWSAPWVRLSGVNTVPRYPPRPKSRPLPLASWFALDVRYTQH